MPSRVIYGHGEALQGTISSLQTEMYLLDDKFRVVCACTEQEKSVTGADFFDLYPANRVARDEVYAYVRSFPQTLLLQRCSRIPVLFVGSFFTYTGQIVAILPQGEIRKTLLHPAAVHGILKGIEVAPFAGMHYVAHEEKTLGEACRYLVGLSMPFTFANDSAASVLAFRAMRLATRCGVQITCDLSGLRYLGSEAQLDFATGVLFAALMAVQRIGTDRCLRLRGVSEGEPVLYLEFEREDLTDIMPEFEAPLRRSEARGNVLDAVYDKLDPRLVQLRVALCAKELSAQGVRERHRFLEGKSPLSAALRMQPLSLPFKELSFD